MDEIILKLLTGFMKFSSFNFSVEFRIEKNSIKSFSNVTTEIFDMQKKKS